MTEPIGFKKDNTHTMASLMEKTKQIEAFFNNEMATVEQFREALLFELKEIEDIKHNMKIIEDQFSKLKIAEKHFDEMYFELNKESSKETINLGKTKHLLGIVEAIVNTMLASVPVLSGEVDRIEKKDTHLLYQKYSKDKEMMAQLQIASHRASEVKAELNLLFNKINSIPGELQGIAGNILKVMRDNEIRKGRNKTIKGFAK